MFTLFSSHRCETKTTTKEKELTFPHAFDFHSLISHRIDFSVVFTDKENQFLIPSMMMSTCCWCSCVSRTAALVSRARFPPFSCRMSFRCAEKDVSQAAQQRARRHDMWNCADKINCLHFLQNHQEKCCLPFGFHLAHSSCSLSWINFPAHLRLFLTFSPFSRPFSAGIMRNFSTISFFTRLQIEMMLDGVQNERLSRNLSWAGPPEHRQRLDRWTFQ